MIHLQLPLHSLIHFVLPRTFFLCYKALIASLNERVNESGLFWRYDAESTLKHYHLFCLLEPCFWLTESPCLELNTVYPWRKQVAMYNNQTIPLSSLQHDSGGKLIGTFSKSEYARIGVQSYSSLPAVEVGFTREADCVVAVSKSTGQLVLECVFPLLLPAFE